jgi:RNA polymerase sigma-B factor
LPPAHDPSHGADGGEAAAWRSDSGAGDVLLAGYRETRNPALKDGLLRTYMPVARSLAWRYRKGPEPLEDLIQVACVGLVKAFDGFDPARGRSFLPYAQATIRGELLRHLATAPGWSSFRGPHMMR